MSSSLDFTFQKTVIQPVTAYGHPITAAVLLMSSLHDGIVRQLVSACVFNPEIGAAIHGVGFYFERTFSGNPATFKGQGPSILYALPNDLYNAGEPLLGHSRSGNDLELVLKLHVPDAIAAMDQTSILRKPSFKGGVFISAAHTHIYPISTGGMRFNEPQAQWEKSDWIFNKVFKPAALCHVKGSPVTSAMKNTLAQLGRTLYNNVGPLYPEHPLVVVPSKPHPVP